MAEMTCKQRRLEILNAIHGYFSQHGYMPTYEEIGIIVGLRYTAIRYHIEKLVEAGDLVHPEGGRRAISFPHNPTI